MTHKDRWQGHLVDAEGFRTRMDIEEKRHALIEAKRQKQEKRAEVRALRAEYGPVVR